MSDRRSVLLGLGLVGVLALICALRFEIAADIRHFLPEGEDLRLARVSRLLADSDQARTVVLRIGGADRAESLALGRELQAQLREDPEVEAVVGGLDEGRAAALEERLFPHRHGLVDLDLDADALGARARTLKAQLMLPQDAAARRQLTLDPLGAWPASLPMSHEP